MIKTNLTPGRHLPQPRGRRSSGWHAVRRQAYWTRVDHLVETKPPAETELDRALVAAIEMDELLEMRRSSGAAR